MLDSVTLYKIKILKSANCERFIHIFYKFSNITTFNFWSLLQNNAMLDSFLDTCGRRVAIRKSAVVQILRLFRLQLILRSICQTLSVKDYFRQLLIAICHSSALFTFFKWFCVKPFSIKFDTLPFFGASSLKN